jgi:SNF2 family DNA or RNA helicase
MTMTSKFKIPQWLAKDRKLSMFLDGNVIRQTEKAYYIEGTAEVRPSTFCLRCGRELTHPVSLLVGYGPFCSEELGIERPDMSSAEALSSQIKSFTKFAGWFPKSMTTLIEGTLEPKTEVQTEDNGVVAKVEGSSIFCTSSYADGQVIRTFPKRAWDPERRAWEVPNSPSTRALLEAKFGKRLHWVEEVVKAPQMNGVIPDELFDYQREGVDFLVRTPRALLGDEMGLGKTVQTIVASLLTADKEDSLLIVCPNSLKWNWAKEFERWAPNTTVQIISGDRATRRMQIASPTHVTIVNYELFRYGSKDERGNRTWSDDVQEIMKRRWKTIVLDEAHRVKNRDAQVTKAMTALTKSIERVYLLTGTPILNRVDELWSLLRILFPREYTSYWRFVERYCQVGSNGFGTEIGPARPEMLPELRQILKGFTLRRLKRDVLPTLPRKLPIRRVWVPLEEKQRAIYQEMAEDMMTVLSSGETVSAAVAVAQITRLKQIVIDPNLMTSPNLPLAGTKVDATLDILESLPGEKVVIFSQFATALKRLQLTLESKGYKTGIITGEVTGESRQQMVDQFQNDPSIQVLLCGLKSGGVGITLTAAHTAIFLDKFWNPALNWQAQERLDRIGQTEPVTIIELLAQDTIEEAIEKLLQHKADLFSSLFETAQSPISRTTLSSILDLLKFSQKSFV